jgi:hypothetical protein
MAKPLYLPGTWTVTPGQEYGQYYLEEQRSPEVYEDDCPLFVLCDEANALLMSKAPEMYEALIDLLKWRKLPPGSADLCESECWANARRVVDAIQGLGGGRKIE